MQARDLCNCMTDLFTREVATVPGLINLMGAAGIARFQPGVSVLDKILAVLLVILSMLAGRSNRFFQQQVEYVTERLLPASQESRGSRTEIVVFFIAYNAICIWLLSLG